MAFVTAIGDIFPLVTAITDTNVSNGCDNGAVKFYPVPLEIASGLLFHFYSRKFTSENFQYFSRLNISYFFN